MAINDFPAGMELIATYPAFAVRLAFRSDVLMMFEIDKGPFVRTETVEIKVVPLGNGQFAISWQESDGSTVTTIQDFDRSIIHTHATLPDGRFLRMSGTITVITPTTKLTDAQPTRNKSIVLDAMTSLFQRRDSSAVERLYAPHYVQHNPGIDQGREALAKLVRMLPDDIYYEPGLIVADGAYVAIHGRIRGWAAQPQIVVDIFRIEDGKLAEHWDVLQDEVGANAALGGVAMFDPAEYSRQPAI